MPRFVVDEDMPRSTGVALVKEGYEARLRIFVIMATGEPTTEKSTILLERKKRSFSLETSVSVIF